MYHVDQFNHSLFLCLSFVTESGGKYDTSKEDEIQKVLFLSFVFECLGGGIILILMFKFYVSSTTDTLQSEKPNGMCVPCFYCLIIKITI